MKHQWLFLVTSFPSKATPPKPAHWGQNIQMLKTAGDISFKAIHPQNLKEKEINTCLLFVWCYDLLALTAIPFCQAFCPL